MSKSIHCASVRFRKARKPVAEDDQHSGADTNTQRHLFGNGRLSYIQIPAASVRESGAFYARVFGWEIRGGSDHHLSFTDATGDR